MSYICTRCQASCLTNIVPAALQRASGGQPSHGGQLPLCLWVAQRWASRWTSGWLPDDRFLWAYSIIPDPPLHLLSLLSIDSGPQQPTWCLHGASCRGTESASSLWCNWVASGSWPPLCEPPYCYQRPTGGLVDVNRWPPWPPRCLLSTPGGWLCSTQKCL